MATVAPPQTPADASAAAPAPGTTGTIALPALPVPAGTDPGDGSVLPARAFSMAAASPSERARALTGLDAAVYYATASESDAGPRAGAPVGLHRVPHGTKPGRGRR